MENGKKYLRRIMLVAMAFLLCTVCSMETKSAKAASRPTVRVTKRTKKEATIKISKSKATGYQVNYKTGSKQKTVTIKSNKTLSTVLKSLKKGATYSVKVRGYKKVAGVTYYSKWSAVKKVKIKK